MPLIEVSVQAEYRSLFEYSHSQPLSWSNLDIHISRLGSSDSDYESDHYEDLEHDDWDDLEYDPGDYDSDFDRRCLD